MDRMSSRAAWRFTIAENFLFLHSVCYMMRKLLSGRETTTILELFLVWKKLFYSSPTLCSLTNIFPSFKTSENKRIKFLERKFCGGIPLSSAHPIFEMWTELLFSCSFPWVVSWAVHAAVIQQNLIQRKNTKLYQKETTFVVPSGGDSEQLYVSLLQPSLRII